MIEAVIIWIETPDLCEYINKACKVESIHYRTQIKESEIHND